MGSTSLPPGFRFHPTDDELVGYYLKRKVDGLKIELEVIPVIDLYKFDPWELPEKSFLPRRDMEWFFFCPRDKKYPNGSRTNRATRSGYWKATGKDRKVFCESSVQGLRKTLVFYTGRAPGGARTDWVMHEYRLCEDLCQATPNFLGAFALCRVVKRNEQVLKMGGDSHGESKGKRSLSSATSDFTRRKNFNEALASVEEHSAQTGSIFEINSNSPQIAFSETQPIVSENNQKTTFWETQYLCDSPKDYSLEQSLFSEPVHPAQFPNVSTESYPSSSISHVSSYASLTEETYLVDELNTQENFTSYPSPLHHMNVYSNEEDMGIFQGPNCEMPPYGNALVNGSEACNTLFYPSMCRQASDVEEASLWLQEDNLLVVI